MANEVHQLAVGTNAVNNLKPFYMLNPPLLAHYPRAIRQIWTPQIGRKLLGTRLSYKTWGKPSVRLVFDALTRDELVYLGTLEGAVTIYVLNESSNAWGTYNGVWLVGTPIDELDKQRKSNAPYRSVPFDVIDLYATS